MTNQESLPSSVPPAPPGAVSMSIEMGQKLPGALKTLHQAWAIYKSRFWVFCGIMIFPILVQIFLGIILKVLSNFFGEFSVIVTIWNVLLFLISLFTSYWGMTALLFTIKDHEERIGIIESYKRALRKIPGLFWVSLLFVLVYMGGMGLLLVPGIILSVYTVLCQFIFIGENIGGLNALLKSSEYVRGHWRGVFWRIFFIILIFLLITSIPFSIFFILLQSGYFSFMVLLFLPLLATIFLVFLGFIFMPFIQTYVFCLYQNLKNIKGDFVFAPKKSKKVKYIVIAILGILLPIFAGVMLASFKAARDKANLWKQTQQEQPSIQVSEGTVHGKNFNYFLKAPIGWVFDTQAGDSQGYKVVFYKTGENWENAEMIMYPLDVLYYDKYQTIGAIIDRDKKDFIDTYKGNTEDGKSIVINDKLTAKVEYFLNASDGYSDAEAYIDVGKGFIGIIMSSSTQKGFNDSLPAFEELVKSFKLLQTETPNTPTPGN